MVSNALPVMFSLAISLRYCRSNARREDLKSTDNACLRMRGSLCQVGVLIKIIFSDSAARHTKTQLRFKAEIRNKLQDC